MFQSVMLLLDAVLELVLQMKLANVMLDGLENIAQLLFVIHLVLMEDVLDQMLVIVQEQIILELFVKPLYVIHFVNMVLFVLLLILVIVPPLDLVGAELDVKLQTVALVPAKMEVFVPLLGNVTVQILDIKDFLVKRMKMNAKDSIHLVIKDSNV